jgi:hypothetical protein
MEAPFWQFGGPSAFVQRVAHSLREGRNVVLRVPDHLPPGLPRAVRRAVGDDTFWRWRTWHLAEEPCTAPVSLLTRRLCPNLAADGAVSPQRLLEYPRFAGNLIWLEGLTGDLWPAWRSFLEAYSHACKSYDVIDRTLLCVVLQGGCARLPLTTDVCLAEHVWRGIVRSVDMLVYCTGLLHEAAQTTLRGRLTAHLAANLALWDPLLASRLVQAELGALLEPGCVLQELARERGWTPDVLQGEHAWCVGAADRFDGRERMHSAALAVLNHQPEIHHRLWKAQVMVVFPVIEERRLAMIRRLRERFGARLESFQDGNADPYGWEWPDILTRLQCLGCEVPAGALREAALMRTIRNSLAHRDPLSIERLMRLFKVST